VTSLNDAYTIQMQTAIFQSNIITTAGGYMLQTKCYVIHCKNLSQLFLFVRTCLSSMVHHYGTHMIHPSS